jgi:hypothetical protein
VNIRYLIALAAILFSASSNAAWDLRFFPTTNAPLRIGGDFAFDVVSSQMVWAVNERVWAAEGEGNWLYFYEYELSKPVKFSEVVLQEAKNKTRSILGKFLDMTKTTNGPNNLVYYEESDLLNQLDLPGDFFERTPPRNLMGHDWPTSNTSRLLGKNYGWNGLYRVLTNLTHTYQRNGIVLLDNLSTNVITCALNNPARACQAPPIGETGATIQQKTKNDFVSSVAREQGYTWAGIGVILDSIPQVIYAHENRISADFGKQAAYLWTGASPVDGRNHVANGWKKELGFAATDLLANDILTWVTDCYPATVSTNPIPWVPANSISSFEILSDQSRVLVGGPVEPDVFTCGLCDLVDLTPAVIDGDSEIGGDIITLCGDDYLFSGEREFDRNLTDDFPRILSNLEISHIIQWDFEYK